MAGSACSPLRPLTDTPIKGGRPEQEQRVREELTAFDGWIGPGRLLLRSIRFGFDVRDYRGHYKDEWIELRDDLKGDDLASVVRHELCHALDDAEDLSNQAVSDLNAALEVLPSDIAANQVEDYPAEVFAYLCEGGPTSGVLLQVPCPAEPPYLAPIYGWQVETVWTGSRPIGTTADAEPTHQASWTAPISPTALEISDLGGSAVRLNYGPDRGWYDQPWVDVDLYTGEVRDGDSLLPSPGDLTIDDLPDDPGCTPLHSPTGWRAGPGAALCDVEVPGLGTYTRPLVWDGTGWLGVGGRCGLDVPTSGVFGADGRVWSFETTGSTISWSALP